MTAQELPIPANERRATERLRYYWRSLSQNAATPDIDGLEIQPRDPDWHKRFLLKEDPRLPMSVFVFCGGNVAALMKGRPLAKPLMRVAPPHLVNKLPKKCLDTGQVFQGVESNGSYLDGDKEILYRYILLPITSPTLERGYIIGAYSSSAQLPAAAEQSPQH